MNSSAIATDLALAEVITDCTTTMQYIFWMTTLVCTTSVLFCIIVLWTIHGYLAEFSERDRTTALDTSPPNVSEEEDSSDTISNSEEECDELSCSSNLDGDLDDEEEEDYLSDPDALTDSEEEEEDFSDDPDTAIVTDDGTVVIVHKDDKATVITPDGTVIVNNDDHADDTLNGSTIITPDGKVIANLDDSDSDDIDVNTVPASDDEPVPTIVVNNAGINDELVAEVINHVMALDQ